MLLSGAAFQGFGKSVFCSIPTVACTSRRLEVFAGSGFEFREAAPFSALPCGLFRFRSCLTVPRPLIENPFHRPWNIRKIAIGDSLDNVLIARQLRTQPGANGFGFRLGQLEFLNVLLSQKVIDARVVSLLC